MTSFISPGKVFRLCVQAGAVLTWNFQRRPCHTLHKHVHVAHVCVSVFSLLNCHGTFCCNPTNKKGN